MAWALGVLEREGLSGQVRERLARALPCLALASPEATSALVDHFGPALRLIEYDGAPTPEQTAQLENLCLIAVGTPTSAFGGQLKAAFNARLGLVGGLIDYLLLLCPPLFKVGITIESPEWKEYLARKGLKFALRMLAGFCTGHAESQELLAANADAIMTVHRLEQLSTEERLGTLAENLMESLKGNPEVGKAIADVRRETKKRRREMAMAVREMHLKEVGVKAQGSTLLPVRRLPQPDLAPPEEPGLVCSICREGYQAQPAKLLALYTFTSQQPADPAELGLGSSLAYAYSTVTHFNVVHVDCHLSAIRSARGREEWESAMLHNANTRCNGLLPLWGPDVPETNFASSLARHNTYIQAPPFLHVPLLSLMEPCFGGGDVGRGD